MSDRSDHVIALGKRLVAQLDADEDLLANWMAHDIAERIAAVENAGANAPPTARDSCAAAILALWRQRYQLPPYQQVFREIEPLLRTLTVLDVANHEGHRYVGHGLANVATIGADPAMKKSLDFALNLDAAARILIGETLRSAGIIAADKAAPWVDAALRAGEDPIAERAAVNFVSPADPNSVEVQASLQKRIEKLEAFAELAHTFALELREQLSNPA